MIATVALGADHAGFELKQDVKAWLTERGHRVIDFGTHSTDSVDYPDFAALVARSVRQGDAGQGVLVCGSGIGMAIAANKVAGVRAALCLNETLARYARQHNGANVIALGATLVSPGDALAIVATFLATPMTEPRYIRRLTKLQRLDKARGGE